MFRWVMLLVALFLATPALFLATPALAVELNATVKGVVTDSLELPIPRVEITVTAPQLQGARTAMTDDQGRYRFGNLPPGDYTLVAVKPGFQTWSLKDFRLPLGTTLRIDVPLLLTSESDVEIVVIERAPAIDVESTRTGAVLDEELLRDLPGVRDYQDALTTVPGVVGGGNPNVHGGFNTSNQYYIDGVNTTDPVTNTFNVNMNYDVIESVQVITGGMDAEYGRSLGGVVNVVTKSGGNTFEGSANLIYQGPGWWLAPREDFDPPEDLDTRNLSQQLALTLGGPILKDKLWFFGALQGDRIVTQTAVDPEIGRDLDRFPMQPRDWRSAFWFGKLTGQLTPEHRVWLHAQGDPTFIDNVAQDPFTLPSGEQFQFQGGWLGSLGHLWTPSDRVSLQTQLYYQPSIIHYHSQLWREQCENFDSEDRNCTDALEGQDYLGEPIGPQIWSLSPNGFNSGEFPWSELALRKRSSLTSALTIYGDLLGEHTLQLGVQAELLRSRDYYPGQEDNGEAWYTLSGDDPNDLDAYEPNYIVRYETNWDIVLTGTLTSFYAQDVWKPHPKLTLRPGLRFDHSSLGAPPGTNVFSKLNVAPRFGAAYDVADNGNSSAFFYYGRFYDAGFLIIGDLLKRSAGFGYGFYNWDAEAGDYEAEPSFEVGDAFLQADDLRTPYSDEFNLGFRQGFGPNWGASATLIYERSGRFWEDDEVNLIWNDEGTDVIGGRNGSFDPIYRLRTPDSTFSEYTSVELAVERSFSRHWTTLTSYTWSRAWGTSSADQASASLDIPEQTEYEIGLQDFDVPHAFKTAGVWANPDLYGFGRVRSGWTFSWNFQAYSGTPIRRLGINDYYGGFGNYVAPSLGQNRLPTFTQIDLRVLNMWMFDRVTEAEDPTLSVGLEVFNLLNTRTPLSAQVSGRQFGEPLDRQRRRRFQVVARGTF